MIRISKFAGNLAGPVRISADYGQRQMSAGHGQSRPDGRILVTQDPGADALQAMLPGEVVAIHEGAPVGVENPFAHVVAVEVEPGGVVDRIPLLLSSVGVAEIDRGGLGEKSAVTLGALSFLFTPGSPVYQWYP